MKEKSFRFNRTFLCIDGSKLIILTKFKVYETNKLVFKIAVSSW